MQATIDEKTLDRYRKILRFESGSTGNEQKVAARRRAAMEEEHPGIAAEAATQAARENTAKKIHDAGFDFGDMPKGFDDSEFFAQAAAFAEGVGPDADHSHKGFAERTWWKAMGWAVDRLKEADFRPPPPAPAPAPKPPKDAKKGSVKRRLYEDLEVYDAFVGDNDDLGEVIEVHFCIPSDLWNQCVRSKNSALLLMKLLEKRVAASEAEELEDDTDDEAYDDD
jgi:hypothetical protein